MTRIAINGLGRIGRTFMKLALENPALEIVAANDISDPDSLAYLIKHPEALPWKALDVQIVVEASGAFETYVDAVRRRQTSCPPRRARPSP
jgi:glyceraldehyde 3-phosphate dehydrogenase (phosphorylating)